MLSGKQSRIRDNDSLFANRKAGNEHGDLGAEESATTSSRMDPSGLFARRQLRIQRWCFSPGGLRVGCLGFRRNQYKAHRFLLGALMTRKAGKFNGNGDFSIGVDFGGTNLRVGSYAGGTDVLDVINLPTRLSEGPECVVRDMGEAILALPMRDYGDRRFAGAGVGTPGPLELPAGILRNPPNLAGWNNFNIREALESMLGFSVMFESDANLAALAESRLGAGITRGVRSLCVLTMGTGVGSGLILDGRVWHGATGMGGEAGHIVVQDAGGAPCGCGGFGCLEQYASASAVLRMARERMADVAPATAHEVALLARSG